MVKQSSPVTDVQQAVPVAQEDREAAAEIYNLLGFGPCQHIIDGVEDDVGVVQIVARRSGEAVAFALEALNYYAKDDHYDSGDVPGHIYVLDDHGRYARAALSRLTEPARKADRFDSALPCKSGEGAGEVGPLFEYPNVAHDGRGWPVDAGGVVIAARRLAFAAADMLATAKELREGPNTDCNSVREAMMWEAKAAALTPDATQTREAEKREYGATGRGEYLVGDVDWGLPIGAVRYDGRVVPAISHATRDDRMQWVTWRDDAGDINAGYIDYYTGKGADHPDWHIRNIDATITSDTTPMPEALLREAINGIADDYMTSEVHHPGYVLIPTERFEKLAALPGAKS